ncbi:(2,3-dihydroxybenzoyl)adenylate synthase [Nocardia sp. NPDC051321]|uniref:(2,3-dihydroxybenzoyl)adenylate synthase n=1 Tax=Nocardia sp. NPDC051321 TaxID=3364323 RepID=UPI0037A706BF
MVRAPSRQRPDKSAVIANGRRYTYRWLDDRADRLAAGFVARGIRRGDRIVVQLPNTPDFIVVCIAAFRMGALPVLALTAQRRNEINYIVEHAGAVAYVVPDFFQGFDFRNIAEDVRSVNSCLSQVFVAGDPGDFVALCDVESAPISMPRPEPGDVAFLLLSGGTTGRPKLIPRTHDDYSFQISATAREMGFGPDGVYLAALPIAHNAALGCPGVLGALYCGATVVLAESASPDEVFPLIAEHGVTLTTLMPAVLPVWLELADLFAVDMSALVIEVGGARLSPELAAQITPRLGCTLSQWFGMAEGILSFTRPGDPPERAVHTQGRPLCSADELLVVDGTGQEVSPGAVGELWVRGPCVLRGYFDSAEYNSEVFTGDGFLRTGDLASFTPSGDLVVVGRSRDTVNRGGEKVPAQEVETHLQVHHAIRSVAVLAVPDDVMGERTCAVVIPAGNPPALAELREFLVERGLAEYKLPDFLEIFDEFPLTPVGKVNKRALLETVVAARAMRKGGEFRRPSQPQR